MSSNYSHIYEFQKIKSNFLIKNNTIIKYLGNDSLVYIPIEFGNISIGKYAFAENDFVETIVCFDNIIEIEMFCFENCKNFKNIYITNKDIVIDFDAFTESTINVFAPKISVLNHCNSRHVRYKKIEKKRLCYPKSFVIEENILKKYTGNSDVVETPYFVKKISNRAFNSPYLKKLIISSDVETIESYALIGCKNLHNIYVLNNAKIDDWSAFKNCSSIQSITLMNNITHLKKDVVRVFDLLDNRNIHLLKQESDITYKKYRSHLFLYIPKTVKEIEDDSHYKYVIIGCEENSYAHKFAKDKKYLVEIYDSNGCFIRTEDF